MFPWRGAGRDDLCRLLDERRSRCHNRGGLLCRGTNLRLLLHVLRSVHGFDFPFKDLFLRLRLHLLDNGLNGRFNAALDRSGLRGRLNLFRRLLYGLRWRLNGSYGWCWRDSFCHRGVLD